MAVTNAQVLEELRATNESLTREMRQATKDSLEAVSKMIEAVHSNTDSLKELSFAVTRAVEKSSEKGGLNGNGGGAGGLASPVREIAQALSARARGEADGGGTNWLGVAGLIVAALTLGGGYLSTWVSPLSDRITKLEAANDKQDVANDNRVRDATRPIWERLNAIADSGDADRISLQDLSTHQDEIETQFHTLGALLNETRQDLDGELAEVRCRIAGQPNCQRPPRTFWPTFDKSRAPR